MGKCTDAQAESTEFSLLNWVNCFGKIDAFLWAFAPLLFDLLIYGVTSARLAALGIETSARNPLLFDLLLLTFCFL